jgi:hypothetical protein
MNALEAARWWVERGFYVIPVPYGEKAPILKDWQNQPLDGSSKLEEYFNSQPSNLGIMLGARYNSSPASQVPSYVCDVDLDVPEARWAWGELGIDSGMCFGRKSNPASHYFFRSLQPVRTKRYLDPLVTDSQSACLIELRGLGSNGKPGLQTVVPPSMHPSGELYEFVIGHSHQPTEVERGVIERAVRVTAAAILIGRHAKPGTYHSFFLALAGALARGGWHVLEAEKLMRAIYRVIWQDEAELAAAEKEVSSTFERFAQRDVNITGLKTLQELLEPRVFKEIKSCLQLTEEAGAPKPAAPKIELPRSYSGEELWAKKIVRPEELIQELIITPGLTLLVGGGKAGKTIFSVQLGFAVASGVPFLDNFTLLKQTPFLIVEWDDPQAEASLKSYLNKSRLGPQARPAFHYIYERAPSFDIAHPEFIAWLKGKITEHQAGYVVLDSYTQLRGIRSGSGDIVKMEAADLRMLADLAAEMKVAIVLIHHVSKTAAGMDWSSRAAGSFAMHAGCATQVYLERFQELPETDPHRLIHLEGRQMRGKVMVLRFCEETLDYDLVLEGPESNEFPTIQKLHRLYGGRRFTAKESQDEFGWSRPTAYRQLSKLVGYGILRKESTAFAWALKFNGRNL